MIRLSRCLAPEAMIRLGAYGKSVTTLTKAVALFVTLVLTTRPAALFAQPVAGTPELERLNIVEQEKQQRFESDKYLQVPKRTFTGIDTGGWYTLNYFNFQDSDNDAETADVLNGLFLHDVRAWVSILLKNDVSIYLRVKKLTFDFEVDPGIALPDTGILEDADLDLGYVAIPWDKSRIQAGRQFLQSGRGLVFSGVLDALTVAWRNAGISIDTFYGTTPNKTHNIDRSIVGFDKGTNSRNFFHFQTAYQWPSNHRVYSFFTSQRDHSDSFDPIQNLFDFHYNSDYVGVGVSGPASKRAVYYAEAIWEDGDQLSATNLDANGNLGGILLANNQRVITSGALAPQRDEIDAFSFRGGLNYFRADERKSVISFEYAQASGDDDRQDVITTFNGNRPGTVDRSFQYFGYYDGGLALSPRLSNMRVARVGHSMKPFKKPNGLNKEIQVANILSWYRKETRGQGLTFSGTGISTAAVPGRDGSAVSDPQSLLFGDDVGFGYDSFVSARVYSDLALVARFGLFKPGDTYREQVANPGTTSGLPFTTNRDMTRQFSLTATASF